MAAETKISAKARAEQWIRDGDSRAAVEAKLTEYTDMDTGQLYDNAEDAVTRDTDTEKDAAKYLAELPEKARANALKKVNEMVKARIGLDPESGPGLKFATGLGAIARGEYTPPREVVANMIVEGKIHWLAAHPGSGKTTIAMFAAIEHMRAGGHVIWLDWEAGRVPTVRRLIECGATVEMVDEENPDHLFHLSVFPASGAEPEDFDDIAASLEAYPGAMVVFDSCSKALAKAGMDENSPPEVTKWTTNIVIPTREAGATVIVVDHVGRNANEKTNYSRGAGSKKADTDIEWFVKVITQFDRETVGKVELHRWKDREGTLPEKLIFEVGDGAGLLPVKAIAVEDDDTRDERNAGLRGKMLAVLQEHTSPERKLSTSAVVELVHANKAAALKELGALVAMKGAGVFQEPGKQNSIVYWYDATQRHGDADTDDRLGV
jgi:hypothetical protein